MQDKIVLITGSTSGIGLEIAKHFAKLKAKIIINGLEKEDIVQKVVIELKALGASDILYHSANSSAQVPHRTLQIRSG